MNVRMTALSAGMALVLTIPSVRAESFFHAEAGLGMTNFNYADGTWVQNALPHETQLKFPAAEVGVVVEPIDHLALHADFVYLGRSTADTMAVPDPDYDPTTHTVLNGSRDFSSLHGSGMTMGLALTVEPYWRWGNWRVGVEGGPFLFRSTWNDTVTFSDGSQEYWHHSPGVELGYVVGLNASYRSVSIQYRHYGIKTRYNPVPALSTKADTLMVVYRF